MTVAVLHQRTEDVLENAANDLGNPFEALDHEWQALCRRHWRSGQVRRWALKEPALGTVRTLADVIPADRQDRSATFAAVLRMQQAGDDLAARALLQLLVPGLIKLTAKWRSSLGGVHRAGWEIIGYAWIHIAALPERQINCGPAGYVLRCIERDLLGEFVGQVDEQGEETDVRRRLDASEITAAPSAEDVALAGPLVPPLINSAVRRGYLTREGVEVAWLRAQGHSLTAAAEEVGVARATAYRAFEAASVYLRRALRGDELGQATGKGA